MLDSLEQYFSFNVGLSLADLLEVDLLLDGRGSGLVRCDVRS